MVSEIKNFYIHAEADCCRGKGATDVFNVWCLWPL